MGQKSERMFEIENEVFTLRQELHTTFLICDKDSYKLFLVALEDFNEEYKSLSGTHFIKPTEIVDLYSKLWRM